MGTISLNMGGVKPQEPLPEGLYDAIVTEIKSKMSKAGNPMLTWTFQITDPEYEGRRVFGNTVLIPESLWVLQQYLEAITGQPWRDDDMDFDTDDICGMTCKVLVTIGEYNGRPNNQLTNVLPADSDAAYGGASL